MANDIGGVWRTIGGRRVFIKDGQDLASAMKESGKFKSTKTSKKGKDEVKERLEIAKDIAKELNPSLKNASDERLEKEAKRLLEAPEGAVDEKTTFYTNEKGGLERSTSDLKKWRDDLTKKDTKTGLTDQEGKNPLFNRDEFNKWVEENSDKNIKAYEKETGMDALHNNGDPTRDFLDYEKNLYQKKENWRDKIKNPNTRDEILDKELDKSTRDKAKEYWEKEDKGKRSELASKSFKENPNYKDPVNNLSTLKDSFRNVSGDSEKDKVKSETLKSLQNIETGTTLGLVVKETTSGWTSRGGWSDETTRVKEYTKTNDNEWKTPYGKKTDEDMVLTALYNDQPLRYVSDAKELASAKSYSDKSSKREIVNVGTDSSGNKVGKSTSTTTYKNKSMNDSIREAYNDYKKKHPNSKMTFTTFKDNNK